MLILVPMGYETKKSQNGPKVRFLVSWQKSNQFTSTFFYLTIKHTANSPLLNGGQGLF